MAAVWGASFLFMRIASPEFGPVALITVRIVVSALLLLPLIVLRGEARLLLMHWKQFLWVGTSTAAFPFTLFSYVTLSVSAGSTSLLNATTPLFSAIIAWLWLKEKLTWLGIGGLILGFMGVFVLASPEEGNYRTLLLPVLAALLATSCYGYGSCYSRLKLHGFSSLMITAGSQVYAALFMLPFGIAFWPESSPGVLSWFSGISLGVLCTAFPLVVYFHLIKQVGVANTVSVTYLIPVFGILWGVIFLDEALTRGMLIGGLLILASVAVMTNPAAKRLPQPEEGSNPV